MEAASAASVGATTSPGGGVGRAGPADSPAGSSSATAIAGAMASNEESTSETRFPYLFAVRAIPCDLLRVMNTDYVVRADLPLKPRASDP